MAEKSITNPLWAGRKWFDGKDEKGILTKLEQVWAIGGSDIEAYSYAEITDQSYYRYLRAFPKIREKRDQLKQKPILAARMTIANNLQIDPDVAKWYLERKRKDEFSTKTEVEVNEGKGKKDRENIKKIIGILTGGFKYDFKSKGEDIRGEVVGNEASSGEIID